LQPINPDVKTAILFGWHVAEKWMPADGAVLRGMQSMDRSQIERHITPMVRSPKFKALSHCAMSASNSLGVSRLNASLRALAICSSVR
jgi:hypothetical protein